MQGINPEKEIASAETLAGRGDAEVTSGTQVKSTTPTDTGTTIPKSPPSASGSEKSQNGLPSPSWELVTPERAADLLQANANNRRIRPTLVTKYARAMEEGRWRLSPDAIAISDDGMLQNGQHRLEAVTLSKESVTFLVITGFPKDAKIVMDTGARRQLADFLHMERGESNSVLVASIVNFVWNWRNRGPQTASSPQAARAVSGSYDELLELYDAETDGFRDAALHTNAWHKIPLVLSQTGGLFFVLAEVDYEAAERFFDGVAQGTGLEKGDPRLTLRNQLYSGLLEARKLRPKTAMAWTIKAWRAFREERTVSRNFVYDEKRQRFPEIL